VSQRGDLALRPRSGPRLQLARTVVDDLETAGRIVAALAAAASDLRELDERPEPGPKRINRIKIKTEQESLPTPDEWDDPEMSGRTYCRTHTMTPRFHAQIDRSSRKPLTGATTTISSGARVIPSLHNMSPLPLLLNNKPTLCGINT